jgi:bud site selection protein 31
MVRVNPPLRSPLQPAKMPKIRRNRTKPPPEGWDEIEPTLKEFEQKMREGEPHRCCALQVTPYVECSWYWLFFQAENKPHEGLRKVEALWPVFRIHHQRSRYIYDLYYKRKVISKELYDFCLKNSYADGNLIAKWRKVRVGSLERSLLYFTFAHAWIQQGYDNLCCLRCIQTRDTNFGTTCICRVPKDKLEEGRVVECVHCGCRGCS